MKFESGHSLTNGPNVLNVTLDEKQYWGDLIQFAKSYEIPDHATITISEDSVEWRWT